MAMGKGRGDGERARSRSPTTVTTADLRKGACVRLSGLKGAAHLNGMTGVCGDWDDTAGRWIVRLENGEQKSLKSDNLTLEEPQEGQEQEEDMRVDVASDSVRMAADEESGFVSCSSSEVARKALASNQQRLEFGGLVDAEDRSRCVDLVVEILAATEKKLRGISFVGCALTAVELQRLAGALRSGVGPQVLAFGVIKNPGVDHGAWRELFEAVPRKAMWLDFGDNKLPDDAIAPLIEGLEGRDDLDKLFLDGNCLHSVSKLCEALPETGVTQLDLGDNQIDDVGAKEIAASLPTSVITILVVGSNPITPDGVRALFEILPRSSLDTLYLDNTGVDDDCLQELAGSLKDSKLTELHLDSTKISDGGIRDLLPHLGESDLTYVDISGNNISEETAQLLESSVSLQRGGDGEMDETIEEDNEDGAEDLETPLLPDDA